MTTFIKNYIGKGTQVDGMDIVKIYIPVEKLEECLFEKDGIRYVGFEVAKMLNADKFGRTHTVYYTSKEVQAPAEKPKKQSKRKKTEEAEIPY